MMSCFVVSWGYAMKSVFTTAILSLLFFHSSLFSQEPTEKVDSSDSVFATARKEAQSVEVLVNNSPVKLRPSPLYTYDDSVRDWNKGTTWIFGEKGRPDVALNLSTNGNVRCIELISFSSQSVAVTTSKAQKWQPSGKWDPTPIPNAPKPAVTRSTRLIQMRRMARSFAADQTDHLEGTYGLRLLPQPIYRYETESKSSLDGAFFAFVRESDLEIILVIDASKNDSGESQWNFACRTVSLCKQEVRLDENRVWGHEGRAPDPSQYQVFRQIAK